MQTEDFTVSTLLEDLEYFRRDWTGEIEYMEQMLKDIRDKMNAKHQVKQHRLFGRTPEAKRELMIARSILSDLRQLKRNLNNSIDELENLEG
jgi:predicted  nucleic acid-binding Zn-ribbon protein